MKKLPKISIVILLILVLLVSTFSGCGQKQSSNSEVTNKEDTTSQSPPSEISNKPEKLVFFNIAYNNIPKENEPKVGEYIKEKFGIDIEIIGIGQAAAEQALSLKLASNEQLDCFYDYLKWPQYKEKGAIQDLTETIQKYGPNLTKLMDPDVWGYVSDENDKIWGIPNYYGLYSNGIATIRTDWLQKLNAEMPTTIEEFEELLEKVKNTDLNGNGKNDEIGFGWPGLGWKMGGTLLPSFTGTGVKDIFQLDACFVDEDGKLKPLQFHPGFKLWLETMADWYKKGYIHKDMYSMTNEELYNMGDVLFSQCGWVSNSYYYLERARAANPEVNFQVIPPLKGPGGAYYNKYGMCAHALMVPKRSKNAEWVVKFFDLMMSDMDFYLATMYTVDNAYWVDRENKIYSLKNPNFGETYASSYNFFGNPVYWGYEMKDDLWSQVLVPFMRDLEVFNSKNMLVSFDNFGFNEDIENLKNVANVNDLNIFRDENLIKFLKNERPISEYDNFINDWLKMGMDKYIEELTNQYNAWADK